MLWIAIERPNESHVGPDDPVGEALPKSPGFRLIGSQVHPNDADTEQHIYVSLTCFLGLFHIKR